MLRTMLPSGTGIAGAVYSLATNVERDGRSRAGGWARTDGAAGVARQVGPARNGTVVAVRRVAVAASAWQVAGGVAVGWRGRRAAQTLSAASRSVGVVHGADVLRLALVRRSEAASTRFDLGARCYRQGCS
ncbi:hypothetical protein FGB62_530g01 [Gracilaria domingensis]|nr:hypothetical protein FGB62_530g01 [Gracilaria domingensis]